MTIQHQFLKAWLLAHTRTERGATLVEYALLLALIVVVCVGAVTMLAGGPKKTFSSVGSHLSGAG